MGHSPFNSGSVALVINLATGHVSPKLHVVFDDDLYTVSFMMKGTIPPKFTDIVKRSSQDGALENVNLKDTWLTTDLD